MTDSSRTAFTIKALREDFTLDESSGLFNGVSLLEFQPDSGVRLGGENMRFVMLCADESLDGYMNQVYGEFLRLVGLSYQEAGYIRCVQDPSEWGRRHSAEREVVVMSYLEGPHNRPDGDDEQPLLGMMGSRILQRRLFKDSHTVSCFDARMLATINLREVTSVGYEDGAFAMGYGSRVMPLSRLLHSDNTYVIELSRRCTCKKNIRHAMRLLKQKGLARSMMAGLLPFVSQFNVRYGATKVLAPCLKQGMLVTMHTVHGSLSGEAVCLELFSAASATDSTIFSAFVTREAVTAEALERNYGYYCRPKFIVTVLASRETADRFVDRE